MGLLNLEEVAAHRLELVASAIDGVVNRLSQVPSVVELSPEVQTLFREPHNVHAASRANVYLEQLANWLGGLELYVLNDKGRGGGRQQFEPAQQLCGGGFVFPPLFLPGLHQHPCVTFCHLSITTQVLRGITFPTRSGWRARWWVWRCSKSACRR